MSGQTYRVKELARVAGVTVRTLHHYDRIGLLAPSSRTAAGYRLYERDDLLRLQQILIYRTLGLPLEQIRRILDDPGFDRRAALLEQREQLAALAGRTARMVRSIDAALETLQGVTEMDARQIFDGFDPAEHEDEVRERWGDTDAYAESRRRTSRYTEDDWKRIKAEDTALLEELADKLISGAAPDDPEVLELAERHRLSIDRWYYPCSRAMHARLAELYVGDERFAASFDGYAPGLARFVADAIRVNADRD